MATHALALGYFFLSVICVSVSLYAAPWLQRVLLTAAVLAGSGGVAYLVAALKAHLGPLRDQAATELSELFAVARQDPQRQSASRPDERQE